MILILLSEARARVAMLANGICQREALESPGKSKAQRCYLEGKRKEMHRHDFYYSAFLYLFWFISINYCQSHIMFDVQVCMHRQHNAWMVRSASALDLAMQLQAFTGA